MEEKKQADLIEKMLSRRAEFVSIRDKADGAIQGIDIIIMDLRRHDEQEQEKEPAETGEGAADTPSTGNGYAYQEPGVNPGTAANKE